jgi:hypothetical protein
VIAEREREMLLEREDKKMMSEREKKKKKMVISEREKVKERGGVQLRKRRKIGNHGTKEGDLMLWERMAGWMAGRHGRTGR